MRVFLKADMLSVVLHKSELEFGFQEVSHAVTGALWNETLEFDLFPERGAFRPVLVSLIDLIHLESLGEGVGPTFIQLVGFVVLDLVISERLVQIVVFIK